MVTRPVARRRKSAQARSLSVNPSRKRRRGGGTISRRMVISSDTPAAAITQTRAQKIMEPTSNQYNLSGCTSDQPIDHVKETVSVRQQVATGIEVTGDARPSEPLTSDKHSEISNRGGQRYAGRGIETSSSDSEHNGIAIGEYEDELYGLAASEAHLEIFAHLRRKLQQLFVDGISSPRKRSAYPELPDGAQTSVEVMKRLDLLSETWTNCAIDDEARRSPRSVADMGSSAISNAQRQFLQIGDASREHLVDEKPLQSEVLLVVDDEILIETRAKTGSDSLGGKYWNPGSKADLLGSSQYCRSQELNRQERTESSGQQLRARGPRLPYHSQISNPIHEDLRCSPKIPTLCTRFYSWEKDQESSHPTPQTSQARNCNSEKYLTSLPSDSAMNLNDTSQSGCLAVGAIAAADDGDCGSTTRGKRAKAFSARTPKLLQPWKNFQDHRSLPILANGFFKKFGDDQYALLVSTKPKEKILSTLEQPHTCAKKTEQELYRVNWDEMPVIVDCQDDAFADSDNMVEAERSELPAPDGLNFCQLDYREEGELQSFRRGSIVQSGFFRDLFEGPANNLSSEPEFSRYGWLAKTAEDHCSYFNSPDSHYEMMGSRLSDVYNPKSQSMM